MKDKPYDKIAVGERIRKARELNQFTQEYIAKLIDVNPSHISDIERGKVGVSVGTVIALCDTLNVTSDYIFFGKDVSHSSNFDKRLSLLEAKDKLFIDDCIQAFIKRYKS